MSFVGRNYPLGKPIELHSHQTLTEAYECMECDAFERILAQTGEAKNV